MLYCCVHQFLTAIHFSLFFFFGDGISYSLVVCFHVFVLFSSFFPLVIMMLFCIHQNVENDRKINFEKKTTELNGTEKNNEKSET